MSETRNLINKTEGLFHMGEADDLDTQNKRSMIKGSNGWELWMTSSQGNLYTYKLTNVDDIYNLDTPDEDEYQETENYFVAVVNADPFVASYVSNAVGGAISFKGKGRWSGNAADLGRDLKMDLDDVSFDRNASFAMKFDDVKKIVTDNFDYDFTFEKTKLGFNDISLDWSKMNEGIFGRDPDADTAAKFINTSDEYKVAKSSNGKVWILTKLDGSSKTRKVSDRGVINLAKSMGYR